jgi:hypothetical protein
MPSENVNPLGYWLWKVIDWIFHCPLPPLLVGLGKGVAVLGVTSPCAEADTLMPISKTNNAAAIRLVHNTKRVRIVLLSPLSGNPVQVYIKSGLRVLPRHLLRLPGGIQRSQVVVYGVGDG